MIKISEILEFARLTGLTEIGADLPVVGEFESVDRITGDLEASKGCLAWLSAKNIQKDSERLIKFNGSLLVCPATIPPVKRPEVGPVLLPCTSPKYAFTRIVNQFFPNLVKVDFPVIGESPCHPTAKIGSNARFGYGVVIGPNVVIGDNVAIGPNSVILNTEIANDVVIGANCSIGLPGFGYEKDESGRSWRFPHLGKVIIESGVEIGSNTCIDRGALGNTLIKVDTKIDNLVHVAHNVQAGPRAMIIANAMVAGSVNIGSDVWVAPSTSILNQITIGDESIIGMGAVVLKNVPLKSIMIGNPAKQLEKKN